MQFLIQRQVRLTRVRITQCLVKMDILCPAVPRWHVHLENFQIYPAVWQVLLSTPSHNCNDMNWLAYICAAWYQMQCASRAWFLNSSSKILSFEFQAVTNPRSITRLSPQRMQKSILGPSTLYSVDKDTQFQGRQKLLAMRGNFLQVLLAFNNVPNQTSIMQPSPQPMQILILGRNTLCNVGRDTQFQGLQK